MNIIESIGDNIGSFICVLIVLVAIIAVIRVIVKLYRGEDVEITAVGMMNELPSSITGIHKYDDALIVDESENKK